MHGPCSQPLCLKHSAVRMVHVASNYVDNTDMVMMQMMKMDSLTAIMHAQHLQMTDGGSKAMHKIVGIQVQAGDR